jgi:hypothetical protein
MDYKFLLQSFSKKSTMMHQNVNVVDTESSQVVIFGLHCNMHSPYKVDDNNYVLKKHLQFIKLHHIM